METKMSLSTKIKAAFVIISCFFGVPGFMLVISRLIGIGFENTLFVLITVILSFINLWIFTGLTFRKEVNAEIEEREQKLRAQYESKIIEIMKALHTVDAEKKENTDSTN